MQLTSLQCMVCDLNVQIKMTENMNLEFNKICRLCMSKDNVLKSIFTSQLNSNLLFSTMIMSMSTVKITMDDPLPNSICVKCIDRILKAYSFKIECEKSEKVLYSCHKKKTQSKNIERSINKPEKISQIDKKGNYAPYILSEFVNLVDSDKTSEEATAQTSSPTLFKCFYCDFAVLTKETLKRHIASKHYRGKLDEQSQDTQATPTSNKCCFCYYVFENEQNLKRHLVAKHLNELNNTQGTTSSGTCHLCGFKAKNISLHLNEHYKHLYCNKCRMKFDDKQKFEAHMKKEMLTTVNSNETDNTNCLSAHVQEDTPADSSKVNYHCPHCKKVFSTSEGLKSHIRVHIVRKRVKPYKCTMCEKSYLSNSKLKAHLRLHSDMHLYKCEDCSLSFNKPIELKHHYLIHAGQLPVHCVICNKGFHNVTQLNEHKKKHIEEKRHSCNACGKSFASVDNLKSHEYICILAMHC